MAIASTEVSRFDWRLCWYSVLVWLLAVIVGGIVTLPWFYLVFPLVLLIPTVLYFRFPKKYSIYYLQPGKIFALGLWLGILWCSSVFILDFIEFIGFDLDNVYVYFLDSRNFLKYPLIILIPIIYSLLLEDSQRKRHKNIVI